MSDRQSQGGLCGLARLYAFGEKIIDKSLQGKILDAIVARTRFVDERGFRIFPASEQVKTINDSTSAGSSARRLMVDSQLMGGEHWISKEPSEDHSEFLYDLTQALLKESSVTTTAIRTHLELVERSLRLPSARQRRVVYSQKTA